jgi:hypothetical protein
MGGRDMINVKILIIGILFLGLSISTVSADPTVGSIVTVPSSPEPLSTITIIVPITGENISSVKVVVSECNYEEELCYVSSQPTEMTLNDNGGYEAEITLQDDLGRSDHLQYAFIVNDSGVDYRLEDEAWTTDLDLGNGDTPSDGDNGGDNGTPGFELSILLIAVFVSIILLKRKR